MYDRLRWGYNVLYGPHTLEVHFKTDDSCVDDFCDHARQLNCTILVLDSHDGAYHLVSKDEEGLIVFVMNIDSTKLHKLLSVL